MNRCPVCNGPLQPTDIICPACGFKLAGATQEFEPISLEDPKPVKHPARKTPATLTVVRGPGQIGSTYLLSEHEMTVGRSPQCDIFLNDMTVSRTHAIIRMTDGDYSIIDTGSFNGIWINNANISKTFLKNGDLVQIGAFILEYQR